MITENLSILKINKLKSQEQYDKALSEGKINPNEIYLTPDEPIVKYVDFSDGEVLHVENNTVYTANYPINTLILDGYPTEAFICSVIFTTNETGIIEVELPSSGYIGKVPDLEENGVTWELSIHNGIIAAGKVVSE